ncbi:sigma-B regulation protein RsbU (phosphoserine phosphatase) [Roseibium hamelinense]|uniref:Sigma-B regulation protein RsbU (Phosphoserine phosphatase) n=1 Tax=Roseibium hamelinense TaxID=150831 RepID=A0A562SE54_9HYPH|nr:SpoIIE family protein phosphatase [Roseibium hamelinense]MTI42583.1 hypothetical protein [Roseibium hamelinense]TWI79539.1 sigma-B regulation protein RsbU (phosphoserine phosphatase) [Roseibium hamelinense]
MADERKGETPEPVEAEGTALAQRQELEAELAHLRAEFADLQLLYEATIEHGEAVEDQLAESNILLKQVQTRLEAELRDASRYVMSILPDTRQADPTAEWLLVPSTELGGDSLGYHDIDEDHFAFYLIDVCGHGVGAALLSVSIINVLRANALPHTNFTDPSDVLFHLNNAFPMERQNNMFFTIWYGVYQRSTRRLSYASGGHPAAIRIRRSIDGTNTYDLLGTSEGMVIGGIQNMEFEQSSTILESGDRLLVLSDGTFEIDIPAGGVLSIEQLAEHAKNTNGNTASVIYEWLKNLSGVSTLPDDYTMVELTF